MEIENKILYGFTMVVASILIVIIPFAWIDVVPTVYSISAIYGTIIASLFVVTTVLTILLWLILGKTLVTQIRETKSDKGEKQNEV